MAGTMLVGVALAFAFASCGGSDDDGEVTPPAAPDLTAIGLSSGITDLYVKAELVGDDLVEELNASDAAASDGIQKRLRELRDEAEELTQKAEAEADLDQLAGASDCFREVIARLAAAAKSGPGEGQEPAEGARGELRHCTDALRSAVAALRAEFPSETAALLVRLDPQHKRLGAVLAEVVTALEPVVVEEPTPAPPAEITNPNIPAGEATCDVGGIPGVLIPETGECFLGDASDQAADLPVCTPDLPPDAPCRAE